MNFNPPAPWGGGTSSRGSIRETLTRFQSTRPVGGRDRHGFPSFRAQRISIHPPRGGAGRARPSLPLRSGRNFNPPAPWGGGTDKLPGRVPGDGISIHPPRGGAGPSGPPCAWARTDFNPPAPWGGGTGSAAPRPAPSNYFNPPAPWGGGTSSLSSTPSQSPRFQSTRPVGGGTQVVDLPGPLQQVFQSTRPVGGRDLPLTYSANVFVISIHPPRGGAGRRSTILPLSLLELFQSTRPVGGRDPQSSFRPPPFHVFQSTRPVGGRDVLPGAQNVDAPRISIHPPRGGAGQQRMPVQGGRSRFQSTRPVGGRDTDSSAAADASAQFQSTRPVGGRDSNRKRR